MSTFYTSLLTFSSLFVFVAPAQPVWKTDVALIILHRSACLAAPENTIPAMEQAVLQGADGIEIDIRKTRDGHFVLYHDDWLLAYRGTASRLENLTLAEARLLDLSKQFGPPARGLRIPLLRDALRFARDNQLRLFLDVKTPGIYDEVMRIVGEEGCLPLVLAAGGQVPTGSNRSGIPHGGVWNYLEGGEEDPDRIREVVRRAPAGAYWLMAEDARAFSLALGRKPHLRRFLPFEDTASTLLANAAPRSQSSAQPPPFSAQGDPAAPLRERQEFCWRAGSKRERGAIPELIRMATDHIDPKRSETAQYQDVYLKIAAACALIRIGGKEAWNAFDALARSNDSMDQLTCALALGTFAGRDAQQRMAAFVASPNVSDSAAEIVIKGSVRLGKDSAPVLLAGLRRDSACKWSVFALAGFGDAVTRALRGVILDTNRAVPERRRAALALALRTDETARKERRHLASEPGLPDPVREALTAAWLPTP